MRLYLGDPPEEQEAPPEVEEWHRIHSPRSHLSYLVAGLVGLVLPNVLCVWLIAVSWLAGKSERGEAVRDTTTPWGVVAVALLLYIPLHELAHAVMHPQLGSSPQTAVVIWPKKLRFGVYYEGCMTRRHWLLMRLAPLVFFSVIPAGLLTLFHHVPVVYGLEVFLQVLMLVNGIGSGGDVVAAIWVLSQVPSKAQICFGGGKAYWKAVSPSGPVVLPEYRRMHRPAVFTDMEPHCGER